MKNKETLEEASERNYNEAGVNAYFNNGFIRGAKWQKEQDKKLYSEEDMKKAFHVGKLNQGREGDTSFKNFIEQLKNK
jgi:hypothetical protein